MFAEDVALFDYHFYQSCCNWRRELCSQTILHLFLCFLFYFTWKYIFARFLLYSFNSPQNYAFRLDFNTEF